jgi:hypothetical protein
MKFFLLLFFFTASVNLNAQQNQVTQLPLGTYQIQNNTSFRGDIVLLDDSHYKLSTETTVGEYKFSATAQRVLFLSGTLKSAFARTVMRGTDLVILLPRKENADIGFKLIQADLQAYYKRN